MIPVFTLCGGSGHCPSPRVRRQGAGRGVHAVDVQGGDAWLRADGFGNEREPPLAAPSFAQVGRTLRLGLHCDNAGAEIQERPAAAAQMSADVEAKSARLNELTVKSAKL